MTFPTVYRAGGLNSITTPTGSGAVGPTTNLTGFKTGDDPRITLENGQVFLPSTFFQHGAWINSPDERIKINNLKDPTQFNHFLNSGYLNWTDQNPDGGINPAVNKGFTISDKTLFPKLSNLSDITKYGTKTSINDANSILRKEGWRFADNANEGYLFDPKELDTFYSGVNPMGHYTDPNGNEIGLLKDVVRRKISTDFTPIETKNGVQYNLAGDIGDRWFFMDPEGRLGGESTKGNLVGPMLSIMAGVIAPYALPGISAITGLGSIGSGALWGAGTGGLSAAASGGDIFKGMLTGGLTGGLSGYVPTFTKTLTDAGINPMISSALTKGLISGAGSAINGGDPLSAILASGLGSYGGSLAGSQFSDPMISNIVKGLVGSGIASGVRGGDIGNASLSGGISGGLSSLFNQPDISTSYSGVSPGNGRFQ